MNSNGYKIILADHHTIGGHTMGRVLGVGAMLRMPDANRVEIHYNRYSQCFEVRKGSIILARGVLWKCENYCTINGYTIGNQMQVNGYKYANLPKGEGVA